MEPSPANHSPHADDGPSDVRPQAYKPKILFAEDDDDFRDLVTSLLRRDGYRVTDVPAGRDVLDALQGVSRRGDEAPALVISDERMPGIRGLEVLRRTREWGWTLPLVLITAFGDDELVAEAAKLGVTVVRKPFDVDDLRTLVRFLAAPRGAVPGPMICIRCGSTEDVDWLGDSDELVFCSTCRES